MSIKGTGAHLSLVKIYRTKNKLSEKLDFSMPYCSILFADSEYITLFETMSIKGAGAHQSLADSVQYL